MKRLDFVFIWHGLNQNKALFVTRNCFFFFTITVTAIESKNAAKIKRLNSMFFADQGFIFLLEFYHTKYKKFLIYLGYKGWIFFIQLFISCILHTLKGQRSSVFMSRPYDKLLLCRKAPSVFKLKLNPCKVKPTASMVNCLECVTQWLCHKLHFFYWL